MKTTIQKYDDCFSEEAIALYLTVFTKEPWNDKIDEPAIKTYFKNLQNMNTFKGFVVFEEQILVGAALGFLKPWFKGVEYYIDSFMCIRIIKEKDWAQRF